MHRKFISALLALSTMASASAFAQDYDRRHDERRDFHEHYDRGYDHRDERGAGPHHEFHRGERLSGEYRNRQYVVDNWRAHRLYAPPRGYHWVQTGPDYVLAAIATGVIAQIVLGN